MDWISVEDRMPEIGERVLVKDDLGGICMGCCKKENLLSRKYISIEGGSQFGAIPNAKYWMPMQKTEQPVQKTEQPESPFRPNFCEDSCAELIKAHAQIDELKRELNMTMEVIRMLMGKPEKLVENAGGEVKFAPFEKLPEAKEDE